MTSVVPFEAEGVRGFLHRPDRPPHGLPGAGLVLTHGAGGNSTAPLLVAAAAAFSAAGLHVLRCDLPFRQRRPSGPPSPAGAAADRAGLRAAVAALRAIKSGTLYHSRSEEQSYSGAPGDARRRRGEGSSERSSSVFLSAAPAEPGSARERPRLRVRRATFRPRHRADPGAQLDCRCARAWLEITAPADRSRSSMPVTICGADASTWERWSPPRWSSFG